MKKILTLAAAALSLTLSGCVIHVSDGNKDYSDDWQKRQQHNHTYIADLNLGSELHSVKNSLGAPDFTDSFELNGKTYRVLHYRTHSAKSDGKTTRDESTPLIFADGKLVGIGESALAVIKR